MKINEVVSENISWDIRSNSNFQNGFQVYLRVNGSEVGHFKYFIDYEDGTVSSDVFLKPAYRSQGYGKLLLLKAAQVASHNELEFAEDTRSVSQEQMNVYRALERSGLIRKEGLGWELTDKGHGYIEEFD